MVTRYKYYEKQVLGWPIEGIIRHYKENNHETKEVVMRSIISIAAVLLFATMVPAQEKSPVTPAGGQETVQQVQGKETPMVNPHEKRMFQGHEFNMRCGMTQPGCCGTGAACMVKGNQRMWSSPFIHQHRYLMHGFIKMLFLGFIIINVLLTVIVSLDMARIGQFNGLWVPVILITGIPGAAIYALFRIGNKIAVKNGA